MAHILHIDDDDNIRKPVRFGLERAGHQVDEAIDGNAGVELCRQNPPDLVICDILMPDMDGFEAMRTLKNDFPDMPILVLSGSMKDYLEMALDLGADFVLSKPFRLSALQIAVADLLGKPTRL